MGKRPAAVELFVGNMGSIQWEIRPSMQREDKPTMETGLERIAAKVAATKAVPPLLGAAGFRSAVNQLPTSVVREICTLRSVGAGGGRPPPATRWALSNERPVRCGLLGKQTHLLSSMENGESLASLGEKPVR
jgi:hypothetical protein